MKLYAILMLGAVMAACPVRSDDTACLLLHLPFDGTTGMGHGADAAFEFAEGVRGKCICLGQNSTNRLEYAVEGRLNPRCGTIAAWLKCAWQDRPADCWRHVAVSWDEKGPRFHVDGVSADWPLEDLSPSILLTFDGGSAGRFVVGGLAAGRTRDFQLDELRIYSAPLSDAQIQELWSRETVAYIKLDKKVVAANAAVSLEASCTSPSKCDLSSLRYAIYRKDGSHFLTYGGHVSRHATRLAVNLPPGEYVLRATDGHWQYGCAPFAAQVSTQPASAPPKRDSGIKRFWNDLRNFDPQRYYHLH